MAVIGKTKSIKDIILETDVHKEIDVWHTKLASFKTSVSSINNEREKETDKIKFSYQEGKPGFIIATRIQ